MTFFLPLCPFHPFCLLWVCSCPVGGLVAVLLRMHVTVLQAGSKKTLYDWMKTNQTPGIRHTKNSGRLKSGAFESSTRLTPQHLQPTLSELRKLRTKTSAAHNLSAENYSSLSKKRKAKWVKQCERFISFHLTAFQRAVCGHGTVTHFKAVSHSRDDAGDAAVWGTARRNRWPLPCSPALVSQGASLRLNSEQFLVTSGVSFLQQY